MAPNNDTHPPHAHGGTPHPPHKQKLGVSRAPPSCPARTFAIFLCSSCTTSRRFVCGPASIVKTPPCKRQGGPVSRPLLSSPTSQPPSTTLHPESVHDCVVKARPGACQPYHPEVLVMHSQKFWAQESFGQISRQISLPARHGYHTQGSGSAPAPSSPSRSHSHTPSCFFPDPCATEAGPGTCMSQSHQEKAAGKAAPSLSSLPAAPQHLWWS